MSSTYYDFRDAKVVIAAELKKRGWQIFGYHEDESEMMTDYYDPAYWDGIATKNGYIVQEWQGRLSFEQNKQGKA